MENKKNLLVIIQELGYASALTLGHGTGIKSEVSKPQRLVRKPEYTK